MARHAAGGRDWRRLCSTLAAPDPCAAPTSAPALVRPQTSFLCTDGRAGNVFAATPSDPADQRPVVPGTGIMPSLWGSRGYTAETHPARVGPGRQPRLSANPAIAAAIIAEVERLRFRGG